MATTYCGNCGAPDPGRFCGTCGASQEAYRPAAPASPSAATTPPPPVRARTPETEAFNAPAAHEAAVSRTDRTGPHPPAAADAAVFGGTNHGGAPPEQPRRSTAPLVAGGVALAAVAGGLWWFAGHSWGSATDAAPSPSSGRAAVTRTATAASPGASSSGRSSASPSATPSRRASASSTAQSTASANAKAAAQLDSLYAHDKQSWSASPHAVAQLSAKYDGAVDSDPLTPSGSSVWHTTDILEQHLDLRGTYPHVLLLKGRDVNSTNARAANYWITVVDAGFASKDDANAWCRATVSTDRNRCYGSVTK